MSCSYTCPTEEFKQLGTLEKNILYVLVFGEQVDATGAQIPVAYRYGVALDETISAFQPKELEEGTDSQSIRATQFGAIFKTRYNQLPTSAHSKIIWEVRD